MEISFAVAKEDVVNFDTISVGSIEELSKLILRRHYSLSTFKDGYRNKANFIQARAIGLDVDENMTLAEAEEAFKEYIHIIAPTRSHQVEKNGKTQDRFRVILFLSEPITDADTFEATWYSLAEKFPALDRACKDASRFFYQSKFIHSMNCEGLVVEPVAPKAREKKEVDLSKLLPGDRGKLGKETLAYLATGEKSEDLGRNQTTFKAAKDFQQNLYTFEETLETILSALNDNGTIASDFTEAEVENTVRSAFSTEAKHEPRVEPSPFNLMSVGDLYKMDVRREWVIDKLIAKRAVTLIGGPPKSGKSTLMRGAACAIARGESFLGHTCQKGSVLYFALDEHLDVIKEDFQKIGITADDPIMVHVGGAKGANALDKFVELVHKLKPAIAVVDTVLKLSPVQNANDYSLMNPIMMKLSDAAESGTAVVIIHHTNKVNLDRSPFDSILGSTAIRGGTDANIIVEVNGRERLFSSEGRGGMKWYTRQPLVFDYKSHTYSMAPVPKEEWE